MNEFLGLPCRVAGGFWRRGGETPSAVKREDRIIEICEGSWSYVAGSIGRAPGMWFEVAFVLVNFPFLRNTFSDFRTSSDNLCGNKF